MLKLIRALFQASPAKSYEEKTPSPPRRSPATAPDAQPYIPEMVRFEHVREGVVKVSELYVAGAMHYLPAVSRCTTLWKEAEARGALSLDRFECFLEPEPTNPHDPNAVKVMARAGELTLHLGFLTREDAFDLRGKTLPDVELNFLKRTPNPDGRYASPRVDLILNVVRPIEEVRAMQRAATAQRKAERLEESERIVSKLDAEGLPQILVKNQKEIQRAANALEAIGRREEATALRLEIFQKVSGKKSFDLFPHTVERLVIGLRKEKRIQEELAVLDAYEPYASGTMGDKLMERRDKLRAKVGN